MIHIDTRDTSPVQIDALHPALLVLEANTARLGSDTAAVVREAAAAAAKVKHPWKIFLCKEHDLLPNAMCFDPLLTF